MSVIHGKGVYITYMETEIVCPVCEAEIDIADKADKAKDPVFKMKCPKCKSWLGVSMPIFGGTTECFEWNTPKNVKPQRTVAPFLVNGQVVVPKVLEEDDDDEIEVNS